MSQADFETLKLPLSADHPCGKNLEDTQLLASFDSFRLFGQVTPIEPAPDWREIKTKSLTALATSKDIRLLAHLAAATLRTDGLAAFFSLLSVAAYWIEQYWTQVHPLVEEDAILRKNALNSFADRMAIVDGLRRLPIVANRQLGSFSLRDIEIAKGQLTPSEADTAPADQAQIAATFAAAERDELTTLLSDVVNAVIALKAIESKMRDASGSEAAPAFDALLSPLSNIQRVLQEQLAARGDADEPSEGTMQAQSSGETTVAVGSIRSRQDAIRALDAVAAFFRQNEPSSPIPLFIERAKRLVAKDFLAVLADIAPDAVGQARAAGGLRDE
jgi:type VI secretion system protein ImpA